jgi:hypothetical protein
MAGQVTGNLGNENITLRNMATEDTLAEILEVLGTKSITDSGSTKTFGTDAKNAGKKIEEAGNKVKSAGGFFASTLGGTAKIIRNLDQNIDNISYTFSTMATSLNRTNPMLSKLFHMAGESAVQMQEQYNAYSKMIQVGGTTATGFNDLKNDAAALGTDLRGLAALTDQYAFSLKIGSSSVAGGLKKLKDTFNTIIDDNQMVAEFGRLGVLPQKISEQLLLAAEAQGGVGDVMKRFGGNTGAFSKSMLKSTQELNVFATAIGSNSNMMMQEMAKAQQKITNRIFTDSLTDGEKKATTYLQAFTGSAEDAIGVMRMYKTGLASQSSAMFESLKGYTGMGNQIEKFVGLVSKGTEPFDAIQKSGLLAFANNLSKTDLEAINNQVTAMLNNPESAQAAAVLEKQLIFIKGLKDTDPSKMAAYIKDMSDTFDPSKNKTVDSFTALQTEQIKLAKTTASLNTQINRLGLNMAMGMLKSTNLGVQGLGKGKDAVKQYVNGMLAQYGIQETLSDDIFSGPVDKIEEAMQKLINVHLSPSSTENATQNQKTLVSIPTTSDVVNTKMANGNTAKLRLSDLVNDPRVRATTEAFKGPNNDTGTMIAASLLQQKVKNLDAVTAGDDAHPSHNTTGYHPKGRALDFRVNDDPSKTIEQNYKDTKDNIIKVLKEMGLSEKDFAVINELNAKGGSHMHVEFKTEGAVNKIRDDYLKKLSPKPEASNTSSVQPVQTEVKTNSQNPSQVLQSQVNTIPVVSIAKPDWFDDAMSNSKIEMKTFMTKMSSDFDKLSSALLKKIN